MPPRPKEQCPCCDYISHYERGGYDICKICFWEDDGQDIDKVDEISWVNHMTLRQGRANFREFGASSLHVQQYVLPPEERLQYEYAPRNI
jgi:hypothetical protein